MSAVSAGFDACLVPHAAGGRSRCAAANVGRISGGNSAAAVAGRLARGTPVLVRGDVDAKPGQKVGQGDERLRSMLETLRFGVEHGWKQIIFGHIGRKPEGTLAAVAARLGELLGKNVPLVGDWLDEETLTIRPAAAAAIAAAAPGAVLVLENTRRYAIERALWDAKPADLPALAPKLAKFANEFAAKIARVYVNEALSAGSLDSSSTIVPAAMDRVALGSYVAAEFDGPMRRCLKRIWSIFSGLKIDKLDDLQAMIDRGTIRWVFAAGSLAMALKKAAGQLDGSEFSLGLAEDPDAKRKALFHRGRPHRAGPADDRGRAGRREFNSCCRSISCWGWPRVGNDWRGRAAIRRRPEDERAVRAAGRRLFGGRIGSGPRGWWRSKAACRLS